MARAGKAAPEELFISASLVTDCGCVRQINEDCCQVVMPSDPGILDQKGVLVVVADGMGGYLAGEVASRIAVETVARAYYASDHDPEVALTAAFHEANAAIFRFSVTREELNGMGTTCTALTIQRGVAHSAHVGDSRLYLIRSNSIYQLSEDHSVVKELIKQGVLPPEAARNHADRHLILRALGSRSTVEVATWDQPLPVRPGDSFVLCSDGLHNSVTDEEIRVAAESQEAAAACEALVAVARERGGHDNITVAIARVEG
jgi:protein phosphatase